MDSSDEIAWQQLVSSQRKLFALSQDRIDYVSLDVQVDGVWINVFAPVPLAAFELKRFSLRLQPFRTIRFILSIIVFEKNAFAARNIAFELFWRSFYRKSATEVVFTYRPRSIFVRVPTKVQETGVMIIGDSVVFPPPGSVNNPVPTFLTPLAGSTVAAAVKKHLQSAYGRATYGSPDKNGNFDHPYPLVSSPIVLSHTAFDVSFNNSSFAPLGNYSVADYFRSWVSVNTPNFRTIRKRALPENPYELKVQRTLDGAGYKLTSHAGNEIRTYYGTSMLRYFTPREVGIDNNVHNRAVNKLRDRYSHGLNANIPQTLVQFNQLTTLIGGTARSIAQASRALRRGNFVAAVNWLSKDPERVRIMKAGLRKRQTLSENILALQYGWKPLLSDIYGSLQTLANYLANQEDTIFSVRSHASGNRAGEITSGPFILSSNKKSVVRWTEREDVRFNLRYRVRSQVAAAAAQLGFLNPINLAYEILPFSFVFDWMFPLGPYLEGLSANMGLEFVKGSMSRVVRLQQTGIFSDEHISSDNGALVSVGGGFSQSTVFYSRTPLTDLPTLAAPEFKSPFSVVHTINALALLFAERRFYH